jgi:hypothetical protein
MIKRILIYIIPMLLVTMVGAMEDSAVSRISEQCGRWTVSFNWSDMNSYSKSQSHMENEAGGVRIQTDTLTLTSNADSAKIIKINIMKYSKWNSSLASQSNLISLANSTLLKSGSCKDIRWTSKIIDGLSGVFARGTECKGDKVYYVAAYPADRSDIAVTSSVLAVILSTFDRESIDLLVNSVHIV